jgi:1-acyl-sn-glycerol-3-phosphate acyltransferase
MKIVAKFILSNILGWKIIGDFPNITKSVLIFAPHTSYYDGLFGKLYMMSLGIQYKFLSKKEYFKFPLKYFFKVYGSIPVDKNSKYINQIVELFHDNDELHIVISPEGQLAKTDHWKKGFYYMASNAKVPIVIGYLDYQKKEIGIKGVIEDTANFKETIFRVNQYYEGVMAKYPDLFSLDRRFPTNTTI